MESFILPTEDFNFEDAIDLLEEPEVVIVNKKPVIKDRDLTEITNYLKSYFYQVKGGNYYFYDVSKDEFILYTNAEVRTTYFDKFISIDKNIVKKMTIDYRILYNVVNLYDKPRIYKEKKQYYLNLSNYSILTKKIKKYDEYDETTKDNVNLFLDYILNILCSGDNDQYEYILNWITAVFKGIKNDSILYLRGPEGLGKSTICDFLKNILTKRLSIKCGSEPLIGNFNAMLNGMMLVCFEELPVFNEKEWMVVSSKLKDMATSDEMLFNQKNVSHVYGNNVNNYIICSNNEAIKGADGRRYFVLDLSTEKRNDHEYFGELRERCFNNEVYNAFFNYCYERKITGFYAQNMPLTNNKKRIMENLLSPYYKFIRDKYILKNKGLSIKRNDLYDEYFEYCIEKNLKVLDKNDKSNFYKKLEEVNIKKIKSNGYDMYKISYDDLLKISNREKWCVGMDEDNDNEDNEEIKEEEIKETEPDYKELYLQQKKEIEELKRQLELLKQPKEEIKNNNSTTLDFNEIMKQTKQTKKEVKKQKKIKNDDSDNEEEDEFIDLSSIKNFIKKK